MADDLSGVYGPYAGVADDGSSVGLEFWRGKNRVFIDFDEGGILVVYWRKESGETSERRFVVGAGGVDRLDAAEAIDEAFREALTAPSNSPVQRGG